MTTVPESESTEQDKVPAIEAFAALISRTPITEATNLIAQVNMPLDDMHLNVMDGLNILTALQAYLRTLPADPNGYAYDTHRKGIERLVTCFNARLQAKLGADFNGGQADA